jgi:hypothetical protein
VDCHVFGLHLRFSYRGCRTGGVKTPGHPEPTLTSDWARVWFGAVAKW